MSNQACPICGGILVTDEIRTDVRDIIESHEDCPTCGYRNYFEHGTHYVTIGLEEWEWPYTMQELEVQDVLLQIKDATEHARQKLQQP